MVFDMITVKVTGPVHFSARVPCGRSWPGMRHSDDVRMIIDRALDHVESCGNCAEKRETAPVSAKKSRRSIDAR